MIVILVVEIYGDDGYFGKIWNIVRIGVFIIKRRGFSV